VSDSRSSILDQLRRGRAEAAFDHGDAALPELSDAALFSDFPATTEELLPLFSQRFLALSGELEVCSSLHHAAETLHGLICATPGRRGLGQAHDLVRSLRVQNLELGAILTEFDASSTSSRQLANIDVGVTVADFLVARTGSIALSCATGGGRQLSVLPPIHVVIATTAQLVASVEQAMVALQGEASFATLITGPSRTADIEKILVLGAHGPKRLIVLLLDAATTEASGVTPTGE